MIIQPEKGTRNVNNPFYEAERKKIEIIETDGKYTVYDENMVEGHIT